MDIQWWHWLVFGLVLVLAEVATAGGFYIIFFGISAIVVGLLASGNLAGPTGVQILLFSVLSVVSLVLFRKRLLSWFQTDPQAPAIDNLIGEMAVVTEDVTPGGVGKVELRGSGWSARSTSGLALPRGARCRVTRVEGLMLFVEPEGAR
jgi:membrane protein implicated in regulation of membrane protease activity